jgi:hypothetical protein
MELPDSSFSVKLLKASRNEGDLERIEAMNTSAAWYHSRTSTFFVRLVNSFSPGAFLEQKDFQYVFSAPSGTPWRSSRTNISRNPSKELVMNSLGEIIRSDTAQSRLSCYSTMLEGSVNATRSSRRTTPSEQGGQRAWRRMILRSVESCSVTAYHSEC